MGLLAAALDSDPATPAPFLPSMLDTVRPVRTRRRSSRRRRRTMLMVLMTTTMMMMMIPAPA
jgi:hypothetical protein